MNKPRRLSADLKFLRDALDSQLGNPRQNELIRCQQIRGEEVGLSLLLMILDRTIVVQVAKPHVGNLMHEGEALSQERFHPIQVNLILRAMR